MTIARTLTNRWTAKLTCLLLAAGLWYVIKQNVKQAPVERRWPDPAAAAQSRR